MFAVVSAFPALRVVKIAKSLPDFLLDYELDTLTDVIYDITLDGTPNSNPPYLRQPVLSSLWLGHTEDHKSLFDYLSSTPTSHSLRSLSVPSESIAGPLLGRFLTNSGSSLEHLELRNPRFYTSIRSHIRFHNESALDALIAHLDFSKLTSLRKLDMQDVCNANITVFLSSLPAPVKLNQLTLIVTFNTIKQLISKDHKSLDDVLARPEFSNLEQVKFTYKGPLDRDIVLGELSRVFRSPAARGILVLEMDSPLNYDPDDD